MSLASRRAAGQGICPRESRGLSWLSRSDGHLVGLPTLCTQTPARLSAPCHCRHHPGGGCRETWLASDSPGMRVRASSPHRHTMCPRCTPPGGWLQGKGWGAVAKGLLYAPHAHVSPPPGRSHSCTAAHGAAAQQRNDMATILGLKVVASQTQEMTLNGTGLGTVGAGVTRPAAPTMRVSLVGLDRIHSAHHHTAAVQVGGLAPPCPPTPLRHLPVLLQQKQSHPRWFLQLPAWHTTHHCWGRCQLLPHHSNYLTPDLRQAAVTAPCSCTWGWLQRFPLLAPLAVTEAEA
jgi:hypothetical protein